jgi:hypothetical protein
MICILAGNYPEAVRWASANELDSNEWFYPMNVEDLYSKQNFHVIVVGSAGQNVPPQFFERVYQLAKQRGRLNRKW